MSMQAESRLRSSSLAAWDLNRTLHVTENYAFTPFQILLDPDFNLTINQSVKLTEQKESTDIADSIQYVKCFGSAPQGVPTTDTAAVKIWRRASTNVMGE